MTVRGEGRASAAVPVRGELHLARAGEPALPLADVLSTKLRAPLRPPALVPRPRLARQVVGSGAPVTLVVAPPGYGKTTLVAEATDGDGPPTAWLALEATEDEPAAFWRHVQAAIAVAVGELAGDWPAPAHASRPFLVGVLNHLAGLDRPDPGAPALRLVLDGADHLEDPVVLGDLRFFVEHLPAGVHLVMIADRPPRLPWASWRPAGLVDEIGAADLAFTAEEVEAFFDRQDTARAGALRSLVHAVDGWPAAFRLAERDLRAGPGEERTGELIDDLPAIDQYCSAIVERYPPELTSFLFDTCVATRLLPSLCSALWERDGAEELLQELVADQLFVVREGPAGTGCRYQRRFRVFLQRELRRRDPDRLRRRHAQAAAWCEARGWRHAALEHQLHQRSAEEALDLLADGTGEVGPLFLVDRALAEAVAAGEAEEDPRRRLARARLLLGSGRLADAAVVLDQLVEVGGDVEVTALAHADRSLLRSLAGDPDGALADAAQVERHGTPDVVRRVQVDRVRAALLLEDLEAARRWCERVEVGQPADEVTEELAVPAVAARVAVAEGRLGEARALAERASAVADRLGIDHHPALVDLHLALALVAGARLQVDAALHELELAADLAAAMRWPAYLALVELARFDLLRAQVDPAAALVELAPLRHRLVVDVDPAPWLARALGVREVATLVGAGELVRSASLAADLGPACRDGVTLATRDLAARSPSRARSRLEGVPAPTVRAGVDQALVLAEANAGLGNERSAVEHLRRALELAGPEQLLAPFASAGPGVDRLLAVVARAEPSTFTDRVIDLRGGVEEVGTLVLPAPLSPREERVLALLPSRMGNQEIAGELYISRNTLKTHLKSLYRKLGVSSRLEAVEVARSHGLL